MFGTMRASQITGYIYMCNIDSTGYVEFLRIKDTGSSLSWRGIDTSRFVTNYASKCRDIDFKPGTAVYNLGSLVSLTPEPVVYFSTFNNDKTISLF